MKICLRLLVLILIMLAFLTGCGQNQSEQTLTLRAVAETDQAVELPLDKIAAGETVLKTETGQIFQKSPAMFFSKPNQQHDTYCGILPANFEAENLSLATAEEASPFSFEEKDGKLKLSENGEAVFDYNFGMQLADNVPKRYKRSSYVHPIYDLAGTVLTDDFPEDHFHHRGLSWMWPKVYVNDVHYDLWHIYGMRNELEGIHQVFDKWTIKETGPVCALIGAQNHWKLDDGKIVMDEDVLLRVFRKTDYGRAIDVKLTWTARENIRLSGADKKGYGGFTLRLAKRENAQITSQSGHEASDSDLRRYAWTDYSAQFEGSEKISGAAIFQHPYNPEFPTGWCLRYYGILGIAWPGVDEYSLAPQETLTLIFRVWIHTGDAVKGQVEKAYSVYQGQLKLED